MTSPDLSARSTSCGWLYAWRRLKLYLDYDLRQIRSSHARSNGWTNKRKRRVAVEFLNRELRDRPDLRELVTPEFAFEGRRTVISDAYYASLRSTKVTLVPYAVKGLSRTGAIDANGDEHELDVIVLATGFDAANYLGNYRVYGRGGTELHDQWSGEPEAFLGMMVPRFPNFFIMYGPNTNAIPLVSFYQAQASFAAALIRRATKAGCTTIEVRRWAFVIYNDWLQARLAKTVWAQTSSYFRTGTGRVVSPVAIRCHVLHPCHQTAPQDRDTPVLTVPAAHAVTTCPMTTTTASSEMERMASVFNVERAALLARRPRRRNTRPRPGQRRRHRRPRLGGRLCAAQQHQLRPNPAARSRRAGTQPDQLHRPNGPTRRRARRSAPKPSPERRVRDL